MDCGDIHSCFKILSYGTQIPGRRLGGLSGIIP